MGASGSRTNGLDIDMRMFAMKRIVGKGAFGKVRVVEKKDTKFQYALKYINKMECIKKRSTQNVFRERLILEEVDHPFIVMLHFAFQDENNMFMVLDYARGGDLRFHLNKVGGFRERTTRAYAAELSSALEYLHSQEIIHRDLKPDNILLDDRGHVLITDFNIAVSIKEKVPSSQSGTLSYMAPEMFTGKPYKFHVDWWALGIVLFECTYGKRPFRGRDDASVIKEIKTGNLVFHEVNQLTKQPIHKSPKRDAFIAGLLERDFSRRLGVAGIQHSIMLHPWMANIDWNLVNLKQLDIGYVPDINAINYDTSIEFEEMLVETAGPLPKSRHRRRQSPRRHEANDQNMGRDRQTSHAPRKSLADLAGFRGSKGTPAPLRRSKSYDRKEAEREKFERELDFIEIFYLTYSRQHGLGRMNRETVLEGWNALAIDAFKRNKSSDKLQGAPSTEFGSVPVLVNNHSSAPQQRNDQGVLFEGQGSFLLPLQRSMSKIRMGTPGAAHPAQPQVLRAASGPNIAINQQPAQSYNVVENASNTPPKAQSVTSSPNPYRARPRGFFNRQMLVMSSNNGNAGAKSGSAASGGTPPSRLFGIPNAIRTASKMHRPSTMRHSLSADVL